MQPQKQIWNKVAKKACIKHAQLHNKQILKTSVRIFKEPKKMWIEGFETMCKLSLNATKFPHKGEKFRIPNYDSISFIRIN